MTHSTPAPGLTELLKMLGVALLYALTAGLTLRYTPEHGLFSFIWLPSGLALAALLLGGPRYAWSILLGVILLYASTPTLQLPPAIGLAGGATLQALAGFWLLKKDAAFDPRLGSFQDFRQLLIRGVLLSGAMGALIGTTIMLLTGHITASAWIDHMVTWWMGNALGIFMITPFILVWCSALHARLKLKRVAQGLWLFGLAFVLGQIVFLDWFQTTLGPWADGHWLLLMITLVGVRLGVHATAAILFMLALQALLGFYQGSVFFANANTINGLTSYWLYLFMLSVVGMALSTSFQERRRIMADLRVAAIAFECQEGIVVTDANQKILRVNQAFTQMTGYTQQEAQGQTTAILHSGRHPSSFYDAVWHETQRTGAWQGEMLHRRKNGQDYPDRVTLTAVRDEHGQATHYVCSLTDASNSQLQEQQRLRNEAAQRKLLVREVHHRIKNNLQGITGVLRQFAQQHPELAAPLKEAIGRVQGIAVIHGLQGRAPTSSVRLCELTVAIAEQVQNLWQTPVTVDTPATWLACGIIENEAVPIALILNELILNAVKHGGKAQGRVGITLHKGAQPDVVQITIVNAGQLSGAGGHTDTTHNGLQLIAALMPRSGARLVRAQQGDQVSTLLELAPPVISLELKEPTT